MRGKQKKPVLLIVDDIAMLTLALISAVILVIELTQNLTAEHILLLDRTDLSIALIFLFEFAVRFALARKKLLFFKAYWWELLASIPVTTPATQALRLLRLVRFGAHLGIAYKDEKELQR